MEVPVDVDVGGARRALESRLSDLLDELESIPSRRRAAVVGGDAAEVNRLRTRASDLPAEVLTVRVQLLRLEQARLDQQLAEQMIRHADIASGLGERRATVDAAAEVLRAAQEDMRRGIAELTVSEHETARIQSERVRTAKALAELTEPAPPPPDEQDGILPRGLLSEAGTVLDGPGLLAFLRSDRE